MPISNPASSSRFNVSTLQTDQPICFPGGRLTLSASNPVADVSSSTTFWYLPYTHGVVPFWNNAAQLWEYRPIPESGISITRTTDNPRIVDVYAQAYENQPNSFGIDLQSWQSDTTRLRPLVRKHGIHAINFSTVESPLRTYLGSIRFIGAMGAATMTDTATQRFVFNAYNRVSKRLFKYEPLSEWTYNSSSWRPFNNSNLNRIEMVDGIGSGVVDLTFATRSISAPGIFAGFGLGVDIATTITDSYFGASGDHSLTGRLSRVIGAGYHYVQAMEASISGVTNFYSGNASGLQGTWQC